MIDECIQSYIEDLKEKNLYRERLSGTDLVMLNFSSNDYLSLCNNPEIKQAFSDSFMEYPCGSGASRTVCGTHNSHQDLEAQFSSLLNTDSALLFNSGYSANLGIVALLAALDAHLLIDKSVHASIYDGMKLSGIRYTRYAHLDYGQLEKKLTPNSVVFTESLFSMNGHITDLKKIAELCTKHNALLIVDEAHGFGFLGEHGLGGVVEYGLTQKDIPLRMIGFGKAVGCQGAIVAGQAQWIDALYQIARSHTYTTAMSPALAHGLLSSIQTLYLAEVQRMKLKQLIDYFQQKVKGLPFTWSLSNTPIQQLKLGCPEKANEYTHQLKKRGILCLAMREPTVSRADTGLRIVLNAHHEPEDINNLLQQLQQIYEHLS